jgi:glutamyl-tRNA reductase
MHGQSVKDISKFYVAGINYKKTDAEVRGQFAINNDQYTRLLSLAPSFGVNEFFILSTCNRTEIYGFAEHTIQLITLICAETEGSVATFEEISYIKNGTEAINHLFSVAAGIDSQILGDYEIVGQIKQAVKFARSKKMIGAFMDRLVNSVLQSSKAIKNQTSLSDGTVSVSFAAVQYIREKVADIQDKKVLLLGVGKIGRNTCKNLIDYLDATHIVLVNRTEEKALELANELNLQHAPFEKLEEHIHSSDIILVATNATEPIILKDQLEGYGSKLIIDLSVPCNVEPAAQALPGIELVNVDELSKMKDETLQKREAEVPKAKAIIDEHIAELMDWVDMRKHVPVLKAVKTKLKEIQGFPSYSQLYPAVQAADAEVKIQRVINGMASRMRLQNQGGCHYLQAINEFIATGTD